MFLERRSGDLSSMPWRVRGTLVSWANSSVGTQSCPTPPRRPAVRPDPTRPWYVWVMDSTNYQNINVCVKSVTIYNKMRHKTSHYVIAHFRLELRVRSPPVFPTGNQAHTMFAHALNSRTQLIIRTLRAQMPSTEGLFSSVKNNNCPSVHPRLLHPLLCQTKHCTKRIENNNLNTHRPISQQPRTSRQSPHLSTSHQMLVPSRKCIA